MFVFTLYQLGVFGIQENIVGIWDSVFYNWDGVFGIWVGVFGIWDGVFVKDGEKFFIGFANQELAGKAEAIEFWWQKQ